MATLSLNQARVISPVLTAMSYGIPVQGLIGTKIMPIVPVPKRAVKVIQFGKNREKILYSTRRAPGDNTTRIQTSYGDQDINLYDDGLEGELPDELREEGEDIVDLEQDAVSAVKIGLAQRLEADIFALVNNFAGYPVNNRIAMTATTQLSNTAVNPWLAFNIANQAVLAGVSRMPNTIVFGGLKAFNAVRDNPFIIDRIKYTSGETPSLQDIGMKLGYPTALISLATYCTPQDQVTEIPFFDNSIWIGYVPGNGKNMHPYDVETTLIAETGANRRTPSWGYTYTKMQGMVGNMPASVRMDVPYYGHNNRTTYYPGNCVRAPIVTGMAGGYLMVNVA